MGSLMMPNCYSWTFISRRWEEWTSHFTELLTEDKAEKENEDDQQPQVSDSEEVRNKQKMLWKEKKKSWITAHLTTLYLFAYRLCPKFGSPTAMLGSSVAIPGLSSCFASALSLSALSAPSGFFMSNLPPFAQSVLSTLSTPYATSVLFTPSTPSIPSTLSALFALSTSFIFAMP